MSGMSRKTLLGARRSIPGLAVLAAGAVWLSSWPGKLPRRMSLALLPEGGFALGMPCLGRLRWAVPVLTQLFLQPHRPLHRCCETGGVTPPHLRPLTDCTAPPSPRAEGSRRHRPRGRRPGRHRHLRRCGTGTGTPSPPSEHSWVSGARVVGLCPQGGGLELEPFGFSRARAEPPP